MKQLPSEVVLDQLHKIAPLYMATAALKTHIQQDANLAWSWHELIAHVLKNLTSEYDAHIYASAIMENLFGVSTVTHPNFPQKNMFKSRNLGSYTSMAASYGASAKSVPMNWSYKKGP